MVKVAIVNEKDEVIGAADAKEAVEKGMTRRISRVILFDKDGKILLAQRGKNKKSNPLKWDFSAIGHVDEGENYEQAAYRELEEELGLTNIPLRKVDYFFTSENAERKTGIF